MKQAKLYIVVALAAFLCTGPLRAQIVNIEDKRQAKDTMGWFGQLTLNASLTRNQNRVFSAGSNLRVDYVRRRSEYLLIGNYQLLRVAEQNFLNAGFFHLRGNRQLTPQLDWEAFAQVQYDQRLRLNLRQLLGTGPRLRLTRTEKDPVYLGVLYMYEYDEFADQELFYRDQRLSAYLSSRIRWGSAQLSNTSYYQPLLLAFELPRVSTVTTLQLSITDRLTFTSRFSLTHDSRLERDLPDVPATNYNWTNGIRFNWGGR